MKRILTAVLMCGALANFALAEETLTFSTGTSTPKGTIAYSHTTSTLSGIGIGIGALAALTTLNPGVYAVNGGIACANAATGAINGGANDGSCATFTFTSGALNAATIFNAGAPAQFLLMTFDAGGTLKIHGSVPTVTGNTDLINGGSFSFLLPALSLRITSNSTLLTSNGFGTDTKDDVLLAHFGLVNPFDFSMTLNTGAPTPYPATGTFPPTNPASFSAVVHNASIVNTEVVPEPASIALLGIGLFGCGFVARKRLTSKA